MKLLVGLAVCAATLATPAAAQRIPVPEKSPSFERSGPKVATRDMRRIVQEFARCLTRRSMSGVADYLDKRMDTLSPPLRSRAPDCLGEAFGDGADSMMLKGQSDTYRVAFAEAYVVRRYGEAGPGDLTGIAPLVHSVAEPAGTGPQGAHALGSLGECIVRTAPAESWALLATDAASPKEAIAIAALAPAMQACVTRGTTVKMPAFFLRGAIAETHYLLSRASSVGAKGAR